MNMPNYFEHRLSAERYAAARPDVHAPALERFTAFAGLHGALDELLDVGCGTGQSTVALAALARHVLGIDPAESRLANCARFRNVDYTCATAESIPLDEAACDLVVAAQAFHWFDQDAFLGEAFRVLKDAGWLLIYNAWFTGEMEEDAAFLQWFREQYLGRFHPLAGARRASRKPARMSMALFLPVKSHFQFAFR
jgi:ubiquinone/menaquinone biosynthesis C-methylase UbiE